MRLISARIQNYRTHRDISVHFDGNPTLIAGPNESGKSTLIEAIHCGLFLKTGTGGQIRNAMQSDHGGHPEVEIVFEAGGSRFSVRKRFSRNTGTTTLEEAGRPTLNGGDAEDRLAEVLGVDAAIGGGGAEGRLDRRWAHLWVRQGRSGSDPSGDFQDHHSDLVSRLQSMSGAGAVQSGLDRRVHEILRDQLAGFLTDNGKPRAGTPLQQIQEELGRIRFREAAACTAMERLESAIRQLESTDALIAEKSPLIEATEKRLQGIRANLEQVRALKASLLPVNDQLGRLGMESAAIQQQNQQTTEISKRLPALKQAVDGARQAVEELTLTAQKAGEESGRHDSELGRLRKELEAARAHRESCRQLKDCVRLRLELRDLETRSKMILAREEELGLKKLALASIPGITKDGLKKLRALHQTRLEADAALKALAIRVDVLAGDETLCIDGRPAATGTRESFAGAFEIRAGTGVHLRVTPGGGNSMVEAREAFEKADAALREALAGAASLSDAESHFTKRESLDAEIRLIQKGIEDAGGGELRNRLARTTQDLAAAEARLAQRSPGANGLDGDVSEAVAQEKFEAAESACSAIEIRVAGIEESRSQAAGKLKSANDRLAQSRLALDRAAAGHSEAAIQLRTLEEAHGSGEKRLARLDEITGLTSRLKAEKDAIEEKLRDLGAGQIDTEIEMVSKSLDGLREQIQRAQLDRAAAAARLEEAGATDPAGDLDELRDQLSALESREMAELTRIDALRLLVARFDEQIAALEKRFTEPLLEKVGGYLSMVFGPQTRAGASYHDGAFGELTLDRSGQGLGTHGFDKLSGGAREQLGVAFRLAVAGIVAEAHDGCLPVVLDDSFVNSDPARVKSLLLMIYRASQNGLQIILSTCNPADYAELGAHEIRLERPLPGSSKAPPPEPAGNDS